MFITVIFTVYYWYKLLALRVYGSALAQVNLVRDIRHV
jgi:hypothetical protein